MGDSKRSLGSSRDKRQIVDYINHRAERAELPAKQLPAKQLLAWIGLSTSKFHPWKKRYGKVNKHNGKIPRDWWLLPWEQQAIVAFHDKNPPESSSRLCRSGQKD